MISVLGGGVAGLCAATALSDEGHELELIVPNNAPEPASYLAGGMLAPFCEGETAPDCVVARGRAAIGWWASRIRSFAARGTLVVTRVSDAPELDRFARATQEHYWVNPSELEPGLAGRFTRGLFFPDEAHLDPCEALTTLRETLIVRGVRFREAAHGKCIVDCRGIAAQEKLADLRAVRGEMLEVMAPEVSLTRPIRLLHSRFPCYVVPRGDGRYMIGATMVENGRAGPITVRATMDLLSAAQTLHPGFAEAQIISSGAGLRPAFPDNIPVLRHVADRFFLNGLYRHGFLMAPALAVELVQRLRKDQ